MKMQVMTIGTLIAVGFYAMVSTTNLAGQAMTSRHYDSLTSMTADEQTGQQIVEIEGHILELSAHLIEMKQDGEYIRLIIHKDTIVIKNDKQATLDELFVGDVAAVKAIIVDNQKKPTAVEISARSRF